MFILPETKFYSWKKYQCAYTEYGSDNDSQSLPLVLIHPIGVGLSGIFWHRFLKAITDCDGNYKVYNPDLLGCGESDLPRIAYDPKDWANQLNIFLENVVKKPCILVVQGASFPISVYMAAGDLKCDLIKGLILSGPPAWNIMTNGGNSKISDIVWNLFFDSFVGSLFYKYAQRRKFIESFSIKQLFANADGVDAEWLDMLEKGAIDPKNRYAVFSFLAGFWRKDYTKLMRKLDQKILLLMGESASSVSKDGFKESPDQRIELYGKNIANLEGKKISGRNVLPYESTKEFLKEVRLFVDNF
ncbi:alpha/beta fold hydrolase [Cyanobacterium sp. IPPAS B-1200]|uniref:alpha/beta fold hydrolase n=1 Tax=Cyanobacterium sp. IPPAS B-1200 TaxID=1562720 RepID=UPI00085247C0|nr:alpha/beta fold hydrolase [Cyanobacterium sp. IPPAS B-1200]OEJ77838.1 alpha/beta hydrolase [Cyanobacterium sp. IPPAS B-1200]